MAFPIESNGDSERNLTMTTSSFSFSTPSSSFSSGSNPSSKNKLHPMLCLGPVRKMWNTGSPAAPSTPMTTPTPSPPKPPAIFPQAFSSPSSYSTPSPSSMSTPASSSTVEPPQQKPKPTSVCLDFDQQLYQEKVSVRLVQDKGLIVEPEGSDGDSDDSGPTYLSPHRVRLYSCISASFPSANLELDLGSAVAPPPYQPCSQEIQADSSKENSPVRLPPFSRPRNGSVSVGSSSMTPLIKSDHEYKVELTIKPPPSYLKSRQRGKNVNLCCVLVLGFSASLFLSLTLLLAKVLKNRGHHPISIAFWRYLGILIPSIPLILFYLLNGTRRKNLVGTIWPPHDMEKAVNALALLVRVVLGSTAVILRFTSLNYLTIADSSVISYCAPVFAAVFAPFCFPKENKKFGGVLITLSTGVIALFAIFLLSRPKFLLPLPLEDSLQWGYKDDTFKGLFLGILSMLCTSGVLLLLRKNLLDKAHFALVLFVLGLWGSFEAGVLALSLDVLKVPTLPPDIVMLTGVAVLTFFGQLFILLAMQMGKTMGAVSIMRGCDILFTLMWQYLFLKTEPDIFVILSGTLIIFVVWLISFRKWLNTLQSSDKLKKKLSFILF